VTGLGSSTQNRRLADWRAPTAVAVRQPHAIRAEDAPIIDEWARIGFRAKPHYHAMCREFESFVHCLRYDGMTVHTLDFQSKLTLDSLYIRDAIALSPSGLIACRMTKPNRIDEPGIVRRELESLGYATSGEIVPPGLIEAGDIVWLDDDFCAIGISYRTNADGARQFAQYCTRSAECIFVHLPHYRGPGVILHLSSLMSVIAKKLVVADIRYLPVTFLHLLRDRGIRIIPMPETERLTLAANILPIGANRLVSIAGNPMTHAVLTSEGFEMLTFLADNISLLGDGGPTCLTRPLVLS
jgi:N-dimethylarginine dimethylaminohydrolase